MANFTGTLAEECGSSPFPLHLGKMSVWDLRPVWPTRYHIELSVERFEDKDIGANAI